MDHRLCKRTGVIADVAVYCCGKFAGRGKIRNVSRDGLFIDCVPGICPVHICVEVEVVMRDHKGTDGQRMCGYVIHRSGQGIGLMLVDPSQNQLRHLSRLRRDRMRPELTPAGDSVS